MRNFCRFVHWLSLVFTACSPENFEFAKRLLASQGGLQTRFDVISVEARLCMALQKRKFLQVCTVQHFARYGDAEGWRLESSRGAMKSCFVSSAAKRRPKRKLHSVSAWNLPAPQRLPSPLHTSKKAL